MKTKKRKHYRTIKSIFLIFVLLVFAPSISIFSICAIWFSNTLQNQIIQSSSQIIRHSVDEVELSLESIRLFVANYQLDLDLIRDAEGADELLAYNASRSLKSNLSGAAKNYPLVDSVFAYHNGEMWYSAKSNVTYPAIDNAICYLRDYLGSYPSDENPFNDGFTTFGNGGDYFFLCMIKTEDVFTGVIIDTDTILTSAKRLNNQQIAIIDRNGKYLNDDFSELAHGNSDIIIQKSFSSIARLNGDIIIKEFSDSKNFGIASIIDRGEIFMPLRPVFLLLTLLLIVPVIFFGMYFFYLRNRILMPIKRLTDAMDSGRNGSFEEIQMDSKQHYIELKCAYDAFNALISEIETLKIRIYEEKLKDQKLRAQMLQLQIKPHFLLNSLNIAASYARANEYDMVQKMIINIANHFRYILNRDDFVDLSKEIEHTKNFLEIQRIRFTKNFDFKINTDIELMDYQIPVLTIQTFVENSIKHLTGLTREPQIILSIRESVIGEETSLLLCIDDNGMGFQNDVLELLRESKPLPLDKNDQKQHVGISNVRERFSMLFGDDKERLSFSNNEAGGARVIITLPVRKSEHDELLGMKGF